MSEDYIKGFKDGFAIGLEEGKRNQNLNQVPKYDPWVPKSPNIIGTPGCAVCGRYDTGPMGYVCTHPSCPTRVTCYTTGAVGSMVTNYIPSGANGPAGPQGRTGPIDYSMR